MRAQARPTYHIEFAQPAEKQLEDLPSSVQRRVKEKIDSLERNPRPQGIDKIAGEEQLYRVRIGDYRVIYQIRDSEHLVLVLHIGGRKDIYRNLKKR